MLNLSLLGVQVPCLLESLDWRILVESLHFFGVTYLGHLALVTEPSFPHELGW